MVPQRFSMKVLMFLAAVVAGPAAMAAVPNDTCNTATPLSLNAPLNGTTVSAVDDYRLTGSACFSGVGQTPSTGAGGDAVYTFVAPADGDYSFRITDHIPASNIVLSVASECPAGAPPATIDACLAAANRRIAGPAEEVFCLPRGIL